MIIVTYNGRHYLDGCLRSVLNELGPRDELIVADNASTDGSADVVSKLCPEARLIVSAKNRGFAAACKQGARAASGRVLVFLNQDTVVLPGWREGLLHGLAAGDGIGLVTSRLMLMSDPKRLHLCGQDVHFTGLVFGRGYAMPAESQEEACDVNAVSGGSFAIRRALWERLDGFDETLYMYYEDTDLSWRAQMAGYCCRYAPDSQVLHDYRPGSASDGLLYYSFRNRSLLLLKNWRLPTLVLLTPALLVAEVLELGLALRVGQRGIRAKARSYRWIATHLGQVRRMRAAAQAQRRVPDAVLLESLAVDVNPAPGELGGVARGAVAAANLIFRLNHRVALWALRTLGLDARPADPGALQ